ncbi:MAG: hypothetical protein QXJ06_03385 [Candidatus Aenigmatarchaeota archaeon]
MFVLDELRINFLMLLIIISLFFLAFFQRSLIRIFFPNFIGFDTYYHLFWGNAIRKNKFKIPKENDRLIIGKKHNYPYLYHLILSIFPKKFCNKYVERFLNPFIDTIFTCIIFLISHHLTNSLKQSFFISIMYIFTPIMFSAQSTGPRINSATPRVLGEVLTNLVFMLEFIYIVKTKNFILIACPIILSSLAFLSSKFSLQALFFVSIFFLLNTFNFFPLIIFILGMICAFLVSKGRYYDILKTQLTHLRYVFLFTLKERKIPHLSQRNSFILLIKSFKISLVEIWKNLLFNNSFTIIIIKFPLFLGSIYYLIVTPPINNYLLYSKAFIISGILIYLLTSLKPLLFLGEAERYLLHISYFIFFYLSFYISDKIIFYFVIPYGIFFQILDIIYISIVKKHSPTHKYTDELIKYLNNIRGIKNVLTVPFHLAGGWRIIYDTPHNWFYFEDYSNEERKKLKEIILEYPIINLEKFDYFVEKYDIDIVLIEKKKLKEKFKGFKIPDNFKQSSIDDEVLILEKQKNISYD